MFFLKKEITLPYTIYRLSRLARPSLLHQKDPTLSSHKRRQKNYILLGQRNPNAPSGGPLQPGPSRLARRTRGVLARAGRRRKSARGTPADVTQQQHIGKLLLEPTPRAASGLPRALALDGAEEAAMRRQATFLSGALEGSVEKILGSGGLPGTSCPGGGGGAGVVAARAGAEGC